MSARSTPSAEHQGGEPPGAVLAGRAVEQQRQGALGRDQPQRRAEYPAGHRGVDEPPVELVHHPDRTAVTQAGHRLVAGPPGQHRADGGEDVVSGIEQWQRHHPSRLRGGQPVRADQFDLVRVAEIDQAGQPEPGHRGQVGVGEPVERVGPVEDAPAHPPAVGTGVSTEIPRVGGVDQLQRISHRAEP